MLRKNNNKFKNVKSSNIIKNEKGFYRKFKQKKIKKKSYKKYIVIFIFCILFLTFFLMTKLIWHQYFYNKFDDFDNIKPNNESIYYKETYDSFYESINKAKDFLNKNMKGILINKEEIKAYKNPIISAVIPCYNSKNYILRTIRSIQNQNFSNFEIVIVDDFSTDDTISYLEHLQEEDPRIVIIKNKKNMGILYTMARGALSSKGKYIFPIDNDDMFLDKDVFYSVIKVAEKGDFDIVLFEMMISSLIPNAYHSSYKKTIFKKERIPNLVLYQPELSYFPFQSKDGNLNLVEVILNGRCIKTKIYKQALNKLGEERYSRYMTVDADIILNFIIFNTANSMKYIKKYGYIWVDRRDSTSHTVMSDGPQLLLYRIYMLDVLIEMSKNTERHKKLSAVLLSRILFSRHLEKALKKNEYNYNLFISCINRILNSSYISNNKKNEIKGKVKTLSFIKNKF